MLRQLHIKNIAVIEDVTIEFHHGFNVLTGETGAGKSILIDSINMALGERTSKNLIRTGTDGAVVELLFEISSQVAEKLGELGVEPEDDMLLLSRQIGIDGKSKCRLNGRMIPLNMLREISPYLLTIHGQNDNQTILSAKSHLGFVDAYGDYDVLLEKYQRCYERVRGLQRDLDELNTDEDERLHQIDLLKFQIQEIDAAGLKRGEEELLEERKAFLTHAEQIAGQVEEAYRSLYGSEFAASAYDLVADATKALERVRQYDETLAAYASALSSALAEIEDITHELKSFADGLDFEPGELDQVEERLGLIYGLKRKYGDTIAEILEYGQTAKEKLERIEQSDVRIQELTIQLEQEEKKLEQAAEALSAARMETAIHLQNAVMSELADLDMQKMRFSVSLQRAEQAGIPHYSLSGWDRIEFLISGNPGETLKPLAQIASGGEMSRIMLALKSVLADADIVDALIFDEIDTGVSGRAAQKIAEKICMLAEKRQVLCITHLAQIASMADYHYLIEKHADQAPTRTTVELLPEEQRKEELARIIGGVKVTQLTLQAATEMLNMAENLKGDRIGGEK